MDIHLVPWNAARHLAPAWVGAAACVAAWGALDLLFVGFGAPADPAWDGVLLLAFLAASAAGAAVGFDRFLGRRPSLRGAGAAALAAAVAGLLAVGAALLWRVLVVRLVPEEQALDAADPGNVTLRYTLGAWALAGLAAALGPLVADRGRDPWTRLAAGLAAGLGGAAVWAVGYQTAFFGWGRHDLFTAGALAAAFWGACFAGLAAEVPPDRYAGWLLVRTGSRAGHRVRVDDVDDPTRERFVGHYPRGLDLWLPHEEGVSVLHASVVTRGPGRYAARGLTIEPVAVRRLLERVDLRHDPRRPTPAETRLRPGDRIVLSERCVLEFLVLPWEEDA